MLWPRSMGLSAVVICLSACQLPSEAVGPVEDSEGDAGTGTAGTSTGDVVGVSTDPPTSTDAPTAPTSSGGATSTSYEGTTAAETGSTGPSESGNGSTGTVPCADASDCAADEVCVSAPDGWCADAWELPVAVQVISFSEPCDGTGTNLFFVEAVSMTSSLSGCPITWAGDYFTVGAGGSGVAFEFYEHGGTNDDSFITSWCWDQGMGCGPIPKNVLHEMTAVEAWETWSATFQFTPIAP